MSTTKGGVTGSEKFFVKRLVLLCEFLTINHLLLLCLFKRKEIQMIEKEKRAIETTVLQAL